MGVQGLCGRKAQFIGRETELNELISATQVFSNGKIAVVSISGEGGTGKSRLVSEFKSHTISKGDYAWKEAFAYPHSVNIPYSTWIDFINRLFSIEESDSKEIVKQKLEGIGVYCKAEGSLPFIAALYSIDYPETKGIDPGSLKINISQSIKRLIDGISQSGKNIFAFDDLQWADPSSLEILNKLFAELYVPAYFLCIHRPGINLITEQSEGNKLIRKYEMILSQLNSVNEEKMLSSLLGTGQVPQELLQYIISRISGTPFYIEEIVNNLIETKILCFDDGNWNLARRLTETDIPLSIQGVIAARIDRLDPVSKRVLQTASVIGQSFYYSLIKMVTELQGELNDSLTILETIDVIREKSNDPDIEYLFKHAIMRDVVYNSLLKKDRGPIHRKVANLMENILKDRVEEFYEIIAFHYQKSGDNDKAIEYLIKAGGKSMKSYASEEANNFYREAYDIINAKPDRTAKDNTILIRLLTAWGFTHYYLGTFRNWADIFKKHISDADSIDDKGACALFYAELGFALDAIMETELSIKYQYEAIRLAEKSGDMRSLAYANCWIAYENGFRGRLSEGIEQAETGMKIAMEIPEDPYLFAKSGMGKVHCLTIRGNITEARRIAQVMLEFAEKRKNPRCLALAYSAFASSEFYFGNWNIAVEYFQKSSSVSIEPIYIQYPRIYLAFSLISLGRFKEAEDILDSCERYFRDMHLLGFLLHCRGLPFINPHLE